LEPQVFFWQLPHTLAVPPPPQVSPGVEQLPQLSVLPQPSETEPQFFPNSAQVAGTQATHFPAMQLLPLAQVPQL
jgi:hypothetical protein